MANYTIGPRYGMECGPVGFDRQFNPSIGPAGDFLLRNWVSPRSAFEPRFLQGPPMYQPRCCCEHGMPMPNPGYQSSFPFGNPLQDMVPPQPPPARAYGPFQQSIPNFGADYRYPEYGMIKQRAYQAGTLDGTPVTPYSNFQQDQFHTEMLSRLSQDAAMRLREESRSASPREFQALQQNESRLQDYLGYMKEQGQPFSRAEVNRMRSEGIEQLYEEGKVGQGIGQANRENLELVNAFERSEANLRLKYGEGAGPGLNSQVYRESPFNPAREPAQGRQRPAYLPEQQPGQQIENPGSRRGYDDPKGVNHKTAAKPYDPNADSNALYKSMHGGLFGFGHDGDSMFKALDGKSKEEIDKIRANYKDHYGKDLDADLKDKLSGKELDRANALLNGNQSAADAAGISHAFGFFKNDNKGIEKMLTGKSPEQIQRISAEYKNQTGNDLKADIADKMSGADKDQALALLEGDKAKAAAAEIKNADGWLWGADSKSISKALEGKSPQERAAISKAYKEKYGVDLKEHFEDKLGGAQLDEANAALKGDKSMVEAARLKDAQGIFWSDKKAIYAALEGKSDTERKEIAADYKSKYGIDLKEDLKNDLSGSKLEKAEALLEKGRLSPAESLKFALEQKDKDEIRANLAGRSKKELAHIRAEYEKSTGRTLDDDVKDKLSGRDLFQAQQNLKGKPTSIEEAVERANEAQQFQRDGGFGASLVDLFSDKGERLDANIEQINSSNERYQQLKSEGRYDEAYAERANLQKLVGYSSADVENYQDAKDSAANTAGTIAATAAGVAVCVATAGTGTPLVAAGLMAAGAGAAAKVVTSGAIEGNDYTNEQALSDAATGAIDGGIAALGMGAGGKVASAVGEQVVHRTAGQVILDSAIQGAKTGALVGGVGSGAHAAVESSTWEEGLGEGLKRVGTAAAVGAGTGAVLAGTLSGGMAAGQQYFAARAAARAAQAAEGVDGAARSGWTERVSGWKDNAVERFGGMKNKAAEWYQEARPEWAERIGGWKDNTVRWFRGGEAATGEATAGTASSSRFMDRLGHLRDGAVNRFQEARPEWAERIGGWRDNTVRWFQGAGTTGEVAATGEAGASVRVMDRLGSLRDTAVNRFQEARPVWTERVSSWKDNTMRWLNGAGTTGETAAAQTAQAGSTARPGWGELLGFKVPNTVADQADPLIRGGWKLNSVQREYMGAWKDRAMNWFGVPPTAPTGGAFQASAMMEGGAGI